MRTGLGRLRKCQIIRPDFQDPTYLSHLGMAIVNGSHTAIQVPQNAFD